MTMTLPRWDDPDLKGGTMIRGALWLLQEVGEGNTFTKEMIRKAFPGVSQADRRIRDLRDYKWIIRTYTEDATIAREDQRFVKAGVAVWDPAARRAAAPEKNLSAKERQDVLARDDFMCTQCGIAGGESYPDDSNLTAVLLVRSRSVILDGGREAVQLATECRRCQAGHDGSPAQVDELLAIIEALDERDRHRMRRWVAAGRRGATPLERAWSLYRRLPADARDDVRALLGR